jgi:prolipoprotein diacylglyceryltransferase
MSMGQWLCVPMVLGGALMLTMNRHSKPTL